MHAYDNNGVMHDCDIKECRANKWKSGTTDIIHEFDNNYGLQMYFQKQMFLASMTLPRPEGITDEQFYDLVLEDSKVHSEKAKNFGILVHYMVTQMLKELPLQCEMNVKAKQEANKIYEWIKSNEENCIVDIKTTETKDGEFKSSIPYSSWLFQLCGYLIGLPTHYADEFIDQPFITTDFGGTVDYAKFLGQYEGKGIKLINLIVSSNEDIPIKVYPWKPAKVKWGCKVFLKMVELYRIIKKLE